MSGNFTRPTQTDTYDKSSFENLLGTTSILEGAFHVTTKMLILESEGIILLCNMSFYRSYTPKMRLQATEIWWLVTKYNP